MGDRDRLSVNLWAESGFFRWVEVGKQKNSRDIFHQSDQADSMPLLQDRGAVHTHRATQQAGKRATLKSDPPRDSRVRLRRMTVRGELHCSPACLTADSDSGACCQSSRASCHALKTSGVWGQSPQQNVGRTAFGLTPPWGGTTLTGNADCPIHGEPAHRRANVHKNE